MKKSITLSLLLGSLLATFSSCNEDENNRVSLSFEFAHKIGDETLEFDEIKYTNAAGNEYSVVTLKYFISDITLHRSGGEAVLIDEAHYIDATDTTTLSFAMEDEISSDDYSQISFVFGLNETKNIAGSFPNAPESNMEWPLAMGSGYHYMKLEGKFDSSGDIENYQCHTGPTMGNQYCVDVVLSESSFTAIGNDLTIQIVMDINSWWKNPNTLDLSDVTMIMGNETMQQNITENGAGVFSIGTIE
ncbi:MAG: hypothetical protein GY816_06985 [Cytophagales bacterium]|nr:hypothetical protein [Cytophagales bacterium]